MTDDATHRCDISETAILALQYGGLTGYLLPTPHDDIGIRRVDLQKHGTPPRV